MKAGWKRERGVAAIEMTVVLVLGFVLLIAVMLLGRLTWHAIAMQKAVSNAGRIVTAMPFETLTTYDVGPSLQAIASAQIRTTTQSAGIDTRPSPGMTAVLCDGFPCGSSTTISTVSVSTSIRFHDTIFGDAASSILFDGADGLPVTPIYSQAYVR